MVHHIEHFFCALKDLYYAPDHFTVIGGFVYVPVGAHSNGGNVLMLSVSMKEIASVRGRARWNWKKVCGITMV